MRSIGILVTISLVADGLLDLHSLPIRVQFIGDNERQRRAACRAHLRTRSHDPHGAVGIDSEIVAWMQNGVIRICVVWEFVARQKFGVITYAEHKRSCRDDAARQKSAPADVLNRAHAISPAAALIAERIR